MDIQAVIVRRSRPEDVPALAENLRQADRDEIEANTGRPPLEVLWEGYQLSDIPLSVVSGEGEVLAMFGVVPMMQRPKVGAVWLLASTRFEKIARRFARECRSWIDALFTNYELLCNVVDARNKTHIRWLQWCGFTFIAEHPEWGVHKLPFLEFIKLHTEDSNRCANQ